MTEGNEMTSFYLDTSAVVRWILQSPNHYLEFGNWDSAIASTLLKVEFRRTMDRLSKLGVLVESQIRKCNQTFEQLSPHINWVKLDERILEKASQSYLHPIGTLDAIHLVTSYLYQDEFEVGNYFLLTHDAELAKAAISIGMQVKGL